MAWDSQTYGAVGPGNLPTLYADVGNDQTFVLDFTTHTVKQGVVGSSSFKRFMVSGYMGNNTLSGANIVQIASAGTEARNIALLVAATGSNDEITINASNTGANTWARTVVHMQAFGTQVITFN